MGLTPTAAARRRLDALRRSGAADGARSDPTLEAWLRRLGLPGEPRTQLHLAVGGALVPTALLLSAGPVAAVATVVVVAGAFGRWRHGARARRAATDERELPHLLERVARHLRSGGSLAQAFAAATPSAVAPGGLAEAWRTVAERSASGGMVAALDEWAEAERGRATSSVGLAAAALAVAASTGGSPARAVDGVASTLRSRLAVADEVRALSSQARASAMVIALAPLGFGGLAAASDDRTASFLRTPAGLAMLATGLALDGLGAWWMARLCRVRP